MDAPKENLLSLGHLISTEENTFTKQREHYAMKSVNRPTLAQTDFSTLQSQQHLKKMHLQQRWQELKERECAAQQHNRQLLLQFEKAQETLREMLVRNAAMKTIRVEYERYLVESSPRWQQQLEEKTQTAQKKCLQQKMEDCLRSYRKITEDELVTKSSADQPLLSQGATKRPQKNPAPQTYSSQEYSNYNQDGFSHLPYTQSSPLTHSQSHTGRFPIRVPFQPHTSSQVPPSFLQHPHPFPFHHLTPTPGHHHHHHHHPWLRQDPPGWASPQPDYPWSWTAGAAGIPSGPEALWGQIYMEEPPFESRVSQTVGEEKTSRAPSSKAERGGGSRSSHLSQELDVKPVRLSSGQAESSESGRDSNLASRETRKRREKRGRAQRSSSDRERCSSQESSSAIVIASAAVAESSESDAPPEKDCNSNSSRRTRRSAGLAVGSPTSEKMAKERTSSKGDDSESRHTGEELGSSNDESKRENLRNQSPDDKSESCKKESGSQRDEESRSESVKIENGDADENEKESSSCEESSSEEKDKGERKKSLVAEEDDGDEEKSQRDEQQEDRNVEGDDEQVCTRNNTTEEEEAAEEEMEEQGGDEESNSLKEKDGENIEQDSTSSSQDEEEEEDENEGNEDKLEENNEESDEEEDEDGSEGNEDKLEENKEESDEEEDEDGSEGIEDSVGEDEEGSNKEEDGESEDEEEHERDEGKPEDRDSDDSIICPQEKRPIQVQVIPEEAPEDDEGDEEEEEEKSKTGSSNDDSNEYSDEDIEDLLAPQEQTKEEKDPKAEKPKAFPDSMKIFQVEQDTSKTNHPNNSDEFDDFYD